MLMKDEDDSASDSQFEEDYETQGPLSTLSLLLLTCTSFGLQVVWSVLMSSGTSFLLSLGLSKSLTALAWVAGPLAGLIIQPLVGAHSDRSIHPWGKRRPYIAGGASLTVFCILGLAWTSDLVRSLTTLFDIEPSAVHGATIALAVLWIYALNTAIQPVQSGIRALIIDSCPASQQVEASAWASRFNGLGSIFSLLIVSTAHLDFKGLCVIASVALTTTVSISCLSTREKILHLQCKEFTDDMTGSPQGLIARIRGSIKYLPSKIRKVCQVQFFAWMAWFPFLYYNTTYVGELYTRPLLATLGGQSQEIRDAVRGQAASMGAMATLVFAMIALAVNLVVPPFVQSPSRHSAKHYEISHSSILGTKVGRPRLSRVWALSQVLLAIFMLLAIFVTSARAGSTLIALAGISWAFTIWAPFALIAAEIAEIRDIDPHGENQAAAIMGVHNMVIAAPQIIAALVCSGLFYTLQRFGVEDGMKWVFAITSVPALIAAYLAHRIED